MIRHVRPRALVLSALVVAAPLPFGSVAPGPASALLLGALAALLLALWTPESSAAPDSDESLPRELAIATTALAAVALLGWLQSLPVPAAISGLLAPETVRLTEQARELAGSAPGQAAEAGSRSGGQSGALSLAPAASRSAALDWLLPAAGFLTAAWIGESRRVRRTLGGALLLAAVAQVVLGVVQWISRSSTLWGVTLTPTGSRLRGSFVNPNHLALFLEIALAVAFAWVWWSARRTYLDGGRAEDGLLTVGPPALLFLVIFAGLVLTGSRAALLAALAAMCVQGMVIGSRRGRKWLLGGGLAVGLAGVAAIAALGAEGTFARLAASSVDELGGGYRVEAAGATFDLFQLFPVAGSGLGSFEAAFPLVQPPTIPGFWRHAHADWIEYLATTGLVGAALLATALFFYGRRLRQVVVHGERSEGRAAGLAALGALVAVSIHSFADFGLTIPANAFALAVVCGAAGATRLSQASHPSH